jgi:hypothetical protein
VQKKNNRTDLFSDTINSGRYTEDSRHFLKNVSDVHNKHRFIQHDGAATHTDSNSMTTLRLP